ncbi:MAG: branched-chain amino acid transport system ATP-binding protein livM [Chloroflexota bacterium]|jgi:branched-chain amino acid transport system permease protein|nr:branched-chain amino acid transport system ATP-binding protein livM [Chloroflexota bacterium]
MSPPDVVRRVMSWANALPLILVLLVAAHGLLALLGPGENLFVTTLFINMILVLALQVFVGNTGVVSFGHGAFVAIGAYASGILTMPLATKAAALPRLPEALRGVELPLPAAIVVVVFVAILIAIPVGVPIARLSGAAASIATFAFLVISNGILVGWADFTRGTQTFYGVPPLTTLDVALAAAMVAVVVALAFRLSSFGLRLQASAEDELAAAASGIDVRQLRLVAWVLSAAIAAVGGALLGHMLTSFAPGTFYLTQTLSLLTMLILGGSRTVTGAVTGTLVVTAVFEGLRRAENGLDLGSLHFSGAYGLQQLGLGVFLLVAIWLRRDGLIGDRELILNRLWARRSMVRRADRPRTNPLHDDEGGNNE